MNDHSPHTSLLRWFDREKNDIFQFVEKVFLSLVIVVSRKTIPQKLFLLLIPFVLLLNLGFSTRKL